MKFDPITIEVQLRVRDMVGDNRVVDLKLLASAILTKFPNGASEYADLYTKRTQKDVFREIQAEIRKLRVCDNCDNSAQLDWLGRVGFERLQAGYALRRNGRSVYVPLLQMTDEELIAKESGHDRTIAGETQHRDELRRFRLMRASLRQPMLPSISMEPARP